MSRTESVADVSALIVCSNAATLRSVLATSWKAPGLVRDAWLRLDVEKGHREELARLTDIPPSNLSSFNTGRRPLTMEMAQRIADAVPGLTLADLGAPGEAEDAGSRSIADRLAEAEEALNRLGPLVDHLSERVAVLEKRSQPSRQTSASRR